MSFDDFIIHLSWDLQWNTTTEFTTSQ